MQPLKKIAKAVILFTRNLSFYFSQIYFMSYLFTSESVSEGHPDKVSDQISDGILDNFLAFDPNSKVACETLVTTGQVILSGEVSSSTYIDVQDIARDVIKDIGYNNDQYKFSGESCAVMSLIHEQSEDILREVERNKKEDQGAGDQGLMFGFASNESDQFMPLPIHLAHRLVERQSFVRKKGILNWLRPDAKSQVTMHYKDGIPERIDTIVLSTQHAPEISLKDLREAVIEEIIKPVLPKGLIKGEINYLINPTGRFVIGGPQGDCGLTGRKIIVDTYGGAAPHGGGAFSGKDPTKVDRSAAYAARYVAKNIVASGLADKCLVQVSYAIGVAKPTSIMVDSFGTAKLSDEELSKIVMENFDLRPKGIVNMLDLLRPIYRKTAAYGHFGRTEPEFSWEKIDKKDLT